MTVSVWHESAALDVTGLKAQDYSIIEWSATVPDSATLTIDVSYNHTDWYECTNRAALPSMPQDPTSIWVRKTFTATEGQHIDSGGATGNALSRSLDVAQSSAVDMRIDVKPADWSPSTSEAVIYGPAGRMVLTSGGIEASYMNTSSTWVTSSVTAATLGLTDGERAQVRAVFDPGNTNCYWYVKTKTEISDIRSSDGWNAITTDSISSSLDRDADSGTQYVLAANTSSASLTGKFFGTYVKTATDVDLYLVAGFFSTFTSGDAGWTIADVDLTLDLTLQEWPILHGLVLRAGEQLQSRDVEVSYKFRVPSYEKRQARADVPRTGSLKVVGPLPSWLDLNNQICKPYVEIRIDQDRWAKFPLGAYKTLLPELEDDGVKITRTIPLADLLYPVAQGTTTDWYRIPKNRNIVLFVREDILVSRLGLSGFDFPATAVVIPEDITLPANTSWLTVCNTALLAVGWEPLTTNINGEFTSQELVYDKGTEWTYAVDSPVKPGADVQPEDAETPNVLIFRPKRGGPALVSEGNGQRTIKNYTVGPASILERGYEVLREISVEASDQDELDRTAYAEAERIFAGGGLKLGVTVALNPLHDHRDVVRLTRPSLEITQSKWWVTEWEIKLSTNNAASNYLMDLTLEAFVGGDPLNSYGYWGEFSAQVSLGGSDSIGGVVSFDEASYQGQFSAIVGTVIHR